MQRMQWQQGWWRRARTRPSPNYGPRPPGTAVSLVVLHSISLPPGQYNGSAVEQLFMNQLDWNAHPYFQEIRGMEVSAHFFIRRNGRVMQFVSCDNRAWHAGASSWQGQPNCNDYSIGIELEGLEGDSFEKAQYKKLYQLIQTLCRRYPIQQVAGHEHIAPDRKADPGPGFKWKLLQKSLGWPPIRMPFLKR
jgi:N-acetyl-anhydromuramoyl-L-alanine amidase